MANKQVGITSNIQERESYWRSQYPKMKNFRVIARGLTHAQAQKMENKYLNMGYRGHPGGPPVRGSVYSVYIFDKY